MDPEAEEEIETLIEATKTIRNMRAEVNIPTGRKARVVVASDKPAVWEPRAPYITRLAWAEPLEIVERGASGKIGQALAGVVKGADIYLPLAAS